MDVGSLFSSLAISSVGYVAFSYGRRQRRAPQYALGFVLMVFPYFVDGMWLMLAIASVLCLATWLLVRLGW